VSISGSSTARGRPGVGQVTPYVAGALFAAIALALTVIAYFASLYRTSIAIMVATVVLLFVYRIAVVASAD